MITWQARVRAVYRAGWCVDGAFYRTRRLIVYCVDDEFCSLKSGRFFNRQISSNAVLAMVLKRVNLHRLTKSAESSGSLSSVIMYLSKLKRNQELAACC
jgi:hypothetical protein